jgi:hypothetical protein
MVDTQVIPAPDSADPTFRFTHTIRYQYRYQVPVRLTGQVRTSHGRILGDLVELATPENMSKQGILPRSMQNEPLQDRPFILDCRLSPKAIEAIIEEREQNPKKDIQLILQMAVQYLAPSFRLASGDQAGQRPSGDAVLAEPTMWGPGLGEIRSEVATATVTIYASQWSSEFAPAFGVGRYLVVELPEVTSGGQGQSPTQRRISAASEAIVQMQGDINAGHWSECVEHSRAVLELLRSPDELKPILLEDGLSDEAADDMLKSMKSAFDFASKFLKKTARGSAQLNPALVAKKEDAYYVYSTSVALVNLVARKLTRANGSPE